MKNTEFSSSEEFKNIATRITYLRNNILHMTQNEFSSALKISQTYLSLIESGKKAVSKATIENVLLTFNVNMEWLMFGIGSDDEIFLNHTSKESILRSMPDSSLDELQKTYQLTHNELHFVQWFVTLPSKEREMFLSSLNCISALSHLYPPGASQS